MNKHIWMVPTEIKCLRSWPYFSFYFTELKNVVISCFNDGESKFSCTDTEAAEAVDYTSASIDTLRITSADTESETSNIGDIARKSMFIIKTGRIEVQSTADSVTCRSTSSTVVPEQHSSIIQGCPSKSSPDLYYMYNNVYQVYTVRETLHEQRPKRAKSMEDYNLFAQSSQDTVVYKPAAKQMKKDLPMRGKGTVVNSSSDLSYRETWADRQMPLNRRRSEERSKRPKEDHIMEMIPHKAVIITKYLISRAGAKRICVILLTLTQIITFIILAQYWQVYREGSQCEPVQDPHLREDLHISHQGKVPDYAAYSNFISVKLGQSDGRRLDAVSPLTPPCKELEELTKITGKFVVAAISTKTISVKQSPSPLDLEDDEPEPPLQYQNSMYG
ncbi:hypothetical protein JYU34_002792 [Plutella xylostella]|uniref:Uncharacterized protein n=1 Tax=Plutella xylostella TaxID=51655 RepID=A0ABQ7R364_PLUXY|nr:hypothetical protein JYU34_002792 [Plutella xylostella]